MRITQLVAVSVLAAALTSAFVQADHLPENAKVLTLEKAISLAQKNDPWLIGNQYQQEFMESKSIASGTLPDPKVSLSVANIAADTFDFNQEAMTQFKVGVSQMLPRGDTLAIKKRQLKLLSQQYPYQREDRKAKLAVTVSQLWLDAFQAQESIALIEKDRSLFEQLADVAQASYSSAIGKTRQQDLVRAQLELTRLDDRLTLLNQKLETTKEKLNGWLSSYLLADVNKEQVAYIDGTSTMIFSRALPSMVLTDTSILSGEKKLGPQRFFEKLADHPSVKAVDQKIKASEQGIVLNKQKYKPEWGVNASYGVRDASPLGVERSDLFSVGVSFDVPLFTQNRQDQQVRAAIARKSKIKTEKWLLVRKMIASIETNKAKLERLNQREKLYRDKLLPQMHDQAEASLTAYTNDDGDFAEVVRSRIAELNAQIDYLTINVEREKNIIQLNYFFVNSEKSKEELVID